MLSMEVGPRDYLMEMLGVLSTVLGGSTRYLPMLAAKVDECTHSGIRVALDPGGGRIVDLEDEENPYPESIEPESHLFNLNSNGYNEAELFDFGTLSESSMAWLGSMSEESFGDMTGMHEQPLYQ